MRTSKRLLSVLLAVCMLLGMLPALTIGASAATATRVDSAPSDWVGEYVISSSADANGGGVQYALGSNASLSASTNITTALAATFATAGISGGGTTALSDVSDNFTWVVASDGDNFTIQHKASGLYLGYDGSGNDVATSASVASNNYRWQLSGSGVLGVSIRNVGASTRYLQFNSSNKDRFCCYVNSQRNLTLYKIDSGDTPAPTLEIILVSGSYPTTFPQNGTFSSAGLVVTAFYSDDSSAVVTPTSVSTPDLTTTGEKTVTVTYVEGGITATDTYSITVNPVAPPQTYDVGFYDYANDGMDIVEVEEGDTVAQPANPAAPDGYAFMGWSAVDQQSPTDVAPTFYDFSTPVTGDLELYAVYALIGEGGGGPETFKLSLTSGGTQYYVGARSGSNTYLTNPTSEESAAVFGMEPAEDGKYYMYYLVGEAKQYIGYAGSSTTMTFYSEQSSNGMWTVTDEGGVMTFYIIDRYLKYNTSSPRFTVYGSSSNYPYEFTKTVVSGGGGGYTGYTTNPQATETYTVNYNANTAETVSGMPAAETGVAAGVHTLSASIPVREGYSFLGWGLTAGATMPTATVTVVDADVTVYAIWQAHVTVQWLMDDASVLRTETYEVGQTPVWPEASAPAKASDAENAYTFSGWSPTPTALTSAQAGTTVQYQAGFAATPFLYTVSINKDTASMRVERTMSLTASFLRDGAAYTDGVTGPVWSVEGDAVTVNSSTGLVTAVAEGSAVVTATYTYNSIDYTASCAITVTPAAQGGYTLITQDNTPDDWSGDYIIAGKESGALADANSWEILTPNYDTGSAVIADNHADAAIVDIAYVDGAGTGTILDDGNATSGVDKTIVMEDTGLVTDTSGNDMDVFDTITEIDESYAFTFERIDDVAGIYTVRVKGTNLYIACSDSQTTGNNSLNFSFEATELAQWTFSIRRVEMGSYYNDIVIMNNVGNPTRSLFFNAGGNGQFRDYHSGAHSASSPGLIGATGETNYNLYLFGNPNPFYAQIQNNGEIVNIVDEISVRTGRTAPVTPQGFLLPDINLTVGYELASGPNWTITNNSSANNGASIQLTQTGASDGSFTIGNATSGAYAMLHLSYTVRNLQTGALSDISTDAMIEVVDAAQAFDGVIIHETGSTYEEVSTTVHTGTQSVYLDYYVVDANSGLTSMAANPGFVVNRAYDPSLTWTATSLLGATVSVAYDSTLGWHVDMVDVVDGDIITVTMSGAQARLDANVTYDTIANSPQFKIYVIGDPQLVADTATLNSQDPITIDVLANDQNIPQDALIEAIGLTVNTTVGTQAQTLQVGSYGTAAVVDNEIQFTPNIVSANDVITFYYEVIVEGTPYFALVTIKVGDFGTMTLNDDSIVIDFGLPVTVNPLANDIGMSEASIDGIGVAATSTAQNTLTFSYGTAVLSGNAVTFTPSSMTMLAPVSFYYGAGGQTAKITVIPATNVYFEDSLSGGVFTFAPSDAWLTIGTTDTAAQQAADFVGASNANVYGYDDAYAAYAQYSLGSAHVATVNSSLNKASVSFDFYGTGFDVLSMTSSTSGTIRVDVKNSSGTSVGAYIIDTYYGYAYSDTPVAMLDANGDPIYIYEYVGAGYGDYALTEPTAAGEDTVAVDQDYVYGIDGNLGDATNEVYYFTPCESGDGDYIRTEKTTNWYLSDSDAALYQIPIIKITDLPAGSYNVTITAIYSPFYDHASNGQYDFVFDAVRIYDPCGADTDAQNAYKEDGEYQANYLSIRDEIMKDIKDSSEFNINIRRGGVEVTGDMTTQAAISGGTSYVKYTTNILNGASEQVNVSAVTWTIRDEEGSVVNTLTANAGDADSGLPETKAYVNAGTGYLHFYLPVGMQYAGKTYTITAEVTFVDGVNTLNKSANTELKLVSDVAVNPNDFNRVTGELVDWSGKYLISGLNRNSQDLYLLAADYGVSGAKIRENSANTSIADLRAATLYDFGVDGYTVSANAVAFDSAVPPLTISNMRTNYIYIVEKSGDYYTIKMNDLANGNTYYLAAAFGSSNNITGLTATTNTVDNDARWNFSYASDGVVITSAADPNYRLIVNGSGTTHKFNLYTGKTNGVGGYSIFLYKENGALPMEAITADLYLDGDKVSNTTVDAYVGTQLDVTAQLSRALAAGESEGGAEWAANYTDGDSNIVALSITDGLFTVPADMAPGTLISISYANRISKEGAGEVLTAASFTVRAITVPVGYTASFAVPAGVTSIADITGETVVLPTPVGTPTANDHSYVFEGWVTAEVDNVTAQQSVYAAGSTYPMTADVTFYALYSYAQSSGGSSEYTLVTDASQLSVGANVVIAAANVDIALSTNQASSNRTGTAVTKSGSTLNITASVAEFTLEAGTVANTYAFYTGEGYLYAASSSANQLKTQATINQNASFALTPDGSGVTSVIATGSSNRNIMR
ncbi:MAG: InlB B-repeat-containing protein, partial [Oscillospiraceae bacterium]|nr:InlB B-repeat-containing protein [Oscillospiraceae bacterium]